MDAVGARRPLVDTACRRFSEMLVQELEALCLSSGQLRLATSDGIAECTPNLRAS